MSSRTYPMGLMEWSKASLCLANEGVTGFPSSQLEWNMSEYVDFTRGTVSLGLQGWFHFKLNRSPSRISVAASFTTSFDSQFYWQQLAGAIHMISEHTSVPMLSSSPHSPQAEYGGSPSLRGKSSKAGAVL